MSGQATGRVSAHRRKRSSTAKMARSKSMIRYDAALCTGCGQCELMCALFREGEGGPAHARIRIARNAFEAEFRAEVCAQCVAPSCYAVCPYPDEALCIDRPSGVRYVDSAGCTGCGACTTACPFDPPRIRLHEDQEVAYMCDLCRDRSGGPVCVEYCPEGALSVGKSTRALLKPHAARTAGNPTS